MVIAFQAGVHISIQWRYNLQSPYWIVATPFDGAKAHY